MKAIKSTLAQKGIALYIKALIIGTIAGCAFLGLLLCLITIGLLISGKLPHHLLKWIVLIMSALASMISGYISSRITKVNGLLCGMLAGIIMFIIIFISGLTFGDGKFTYLIIIKLILLLLSGGVGGVKGVNRKEKVRIK